jgi:acetyl-CoA acetyltransferase
MCKELQQIVEDYKKLENTDSYEKKTLTIAAQAIVASRVQKTYNYTSEQIEACVLANHEKLSQDAKFTSLSIQMQQTMGQLIG